MERKISKVEYEQALRIVNAYRAQNKVKKEREPVTIRIDRASNGCNIYVTGRKVGRISDTTIRNIMDDCPFVSDIANDDDYHNALEVSFMGSAWETAPDEKFEQLAKVTAKYIKAKIIPH